MQDWLPDNDIVHLILDAVALMDLSAFEMAHKLGGAGKAPFALSLLLSVLIYAYSYGVRSSGQSSDYAGGMPATISLLASTCLTTRRSPASGGATSTG